MNDHALVDNRSIMLDGTPEMPKVDSMLNAFDVRWRTTVDALRLRASELHKAGDEMEHRANSLEDMRTYLTDVKKATLFEVESRRRSDTLQFVSPTKDD